MGNDKYNIEIRVYPIRPIGEVYKFGAKATIYKREGVGERIVHITEEVWGKTEEETRIKANKAANKWIKENK